MENNITYQNPCDSNVSQDNEKINEIIVKALAKLEEESASCSGQNVPAIGIYHYIKSKINESEEFAQQFLIKTKHISKCFSYLTEIARTRAEAEWKANGSPRNSQQPVSVGMGDTEIFAIVDEYFALDDEAIEARKKAEKEAAEKKKKEAEEKRQKEAAERKAKADKEKAEKAKEAKEKEAVKKKEEQAKESGQLSFM